ncbi:hypothetical protein KPH14_012480 [Odynerus spinipes]|uniref:RAP domain-containing protein n=1 Tax=Odynerus spinipes TaxID=1348599 RepID=A0AAD9RJE4_9HYME|nr:hypothetical protein KPH14_012480 [Odynerus spinipes]
MDRGLKQMIWMSWTLRSRALCSNYAIPSKITQNISQNYWTTHKDIYWSERLEPIKKIMQESGAYSSIDSIRILNTITNKRLNMDLKDALDVLTVLVKIVKRNRNKIDFMQHQGFQILCEQLKQKIRVMSLPEVVECLKLLTFLEIPASTFIMQSLLQIIRKSINELHIDQVHLLLCLLKKMEPTSLSSALLIALPIILPNVINTKLDHEDLHELSLALFRIKTDGEKDVVVTLCKSIQSAIKRNPKFSTTHILKNIFTTLCFMTDKEYDSSVIADTIEVVQERLFPRIHTLYMTDIIECIHAITYSIMNRNMAPYSIVFINTLLETAMSTNVDFIFGCKILKHLNNMQYVHVPFIEYLLQNTSLEDLSIYNTDILLHALSNANYKLIPWIHLEMKFLSSSFLLNCSIKFLLKCNIYLAALDKYYPQLLSAVFVKTHVKTLKLSSSEKEFENLLLLYQSVKTCYPEYKGPWPSDELLTYVFGMQYLLPKSTLKNSLETAMGGSQYVLSSLKTKIGHNIDHAIIMRKGGYPIAFNTDNSNVPENSNTYVEELQYPPESYVILILEIPSFSYSINTGCLLNVKRIQLKTLEKWTGHKCIDINMHIWNSLPKHEKIPYIMQKIRNECNDIIPEM